MKKEAILAEIKRTAEENGGVPLGRERFAEATGIKYTEWNGKYWARWGDAVVEAGFKPNEMQKAYDDEFLLDQIAGLAIKLGRVPVESEMRMETKTNPEFPNPKTLLSRFRGKLGLVRSLLEHCGENERLAQVREQCRSYLNEHPEGGEDADEDGDGAKVEDGYVYLVRSGRFCKIGRSNSAGRREREIALQLPDKAAMKHVIKTDDPVGIEAYWHNRFAAKRRNGEWFELSAEDVRAFKRRKFM